jgi:hypothetical protein
MSTKKKPAPGAQKPAAGAAKTVDVEPIIAAAGQKMPPQLKPMFDKVVLSGMRIMFDKSSHQMMLDTLDQPGPMAKRISDGIIQLMYLMWKQSNHTIPPQVIVPSATVLTLRAFQFLQESKDPEATPQVLGDALHAVVQGILDRFGASEDKLPALLKNQDPGKDDSLRPAAGAMPGAPAAGAPSAPAAGGGMLDQVGG